MTEGRRLEGKVAIVTGASAGIGRSTARALAEVGASVIVTARREDRLVRLASEIEESGGTALALRCDVSVGDDVRAVVARAREAFGSIDILVNNAGVMSVAPLSEARVDDWTRMVEVNINGVLHFVAAVLPTMLELGAAHGIRITDVQPGFVSTELLDGDPDVAAAWEASWAERHPLQPEDVARTIVFAATSPAHVSVSEILVRPTDQPT